MRTLAILSCLAAAALPGGAQPAARAGAGAVTGVVRFASDYPRPARIRVTNENDICGTHKRDESFLVSEGTKGLQNVLVTIEGVTGGRAAAPDSTIRLEQKGCQYVPHFQVAQLGPDGIELEVVNTDPTLHNIHTYVGRDTLFNIGQPASGRPIRKKISQPGVIHVRCDVHNWMEAFVVVLQGQPHAVTDADGRFSIEGVPPGSYTLRAWHEKLGEMTKALTVDASGSGSADFVIQPRSGR